MNDYPDGFRKASPSKGLDAFMPRVEKTLTQDIAGLNHHAMLNEIRFIADSQWVNEMIFKLVNKTPITPAESRRLIRTLMQINDITHAMRCPTHSKKYR